MGTMSKEFICTYHNGCRILLHYNYNSDVIFLSGGRAVAPDGSQREIRFDRLKCNCRENKVKLVNELLREASGLNASQDFSITEQITACGLAAYGQIYALMNEYRTDSVTLPHCCGQFAGQALVMTSDTLYLRCGAAATALSPQNAPLMLTILGILADHEKEIFAPLQEKWFESLSARDAAAIWPCLIRDDSIPDEIQEERILSEAEGKWRRLPYFDKKNLFLRAL